ncbi:hypothetical protein TNCV_278531 [Trichonephila clavipes]|nr:hypothetical protein TNCV_278531 [Trichonephila clavipes]
MLCKIKGNYFRLYFGNQKIQNGDLKNIFSSFGTIKYARVVQGKIRQDPGYGFVTFESEEGAKKALQAGLKEGIFYGNRRLFVNVSLNKKAREKRDNRENEEKFSKYTFTPKTIYVAPIPMDVTAILLVLTDVALLLVEWYPPLA